MHAATTNTTMQHVTNNSTLRDLSSWCAKLKSPMLDGGQGKITSICVSRQPNGTGPGMGQCQDTKSTDKTTIPAIAARPVATNSTGTFKSTDKNIIPATVARPVATNSTGTFSVGLAPPTLTSKARVTGATTPRHHIENKRRRKAQQLPQPERDWWTTHRGAFEQPPQLSMPPTYRNKMCPSGLALNHPAAATLLEYATKGCPALTGQPWTREQMQAAIDRGPHVSALVPDAMKQLDAEIEEKIARQQCRLVRWDDIKHDPPRQLKISPLAMVPHKS